MNIQQLIAQYAPDSSIHGNQARLDQVAATALPWGKQSGGICLALNREYLAKALDNEAMEAVIAPPALPLPQDEGNKAFVVTAAAEALFYKLHLFGLHRLAAMPEHFVHRHVAPSASVHPSAVIADHVYIGENVTIGPYACIAQNTYIADGCHIGPHVVLGEDGLYPRTLEGAKIHMTHWGGVRLGRNCRIGAQCIIARSEYYGESTLLHDHVFLGFQVTIGHNCLVGAGTTISSHATLGGRTAVGADCWIGIGAHISNTLRIGDKASVKLGSVVIDHVNPGAAVSGNFAINHLHNLRNKART